MAGAKLNYTYFQHDQAYFQRTRNLYHYRVCGYQASLTAGTVFHKTRPPLHKWFWMIWLMGRQNDSGGTEIPPANADETNAFGRLSQCQTFSEIASS
jgi:hypothetical protein